MPYPFRFLHSASLTGAIAPVRSRIRAHLSDSSTAKRAVGLLGDRSVRGLLSDFHQMMAGRISLRLAGASMASIVVVAGVFAAGFANGGALPAVEAQIIVKEIVNDVDIYQAGSLAIPEADFNQAYLGQSLLTGDRVKTHSNSEARVDITIREFTRITRTMPNTIWRIGSFSAEEGAVIELDRGKIFLFDNGRGNADWHMDVVTPAGRVAPRGTWFSVSYDPDTGETEVQCFRGECELANKKGVIVLSAAQKSVMTAATPPTLPKPLEVIDNLQFLELPEVKSGEIEVPPQADSANRNGIGETVRDLAPGHINGNTGGNDTDNAGGNASVASSGFKDNGNGNPNGGGKDSGNGNPNGGEKDSGNANGNDGANANGKDNAGGKDNANGGGSGNDNANGGNGNGGGSGNDNANGGNGNGNGNGNWQRKKTRENRCGAGHF